MRIALVTTTIRVPDVLRLYRAASSDVMFFVTGDRKSPDDEIVRFLEQAGSHAYYGTDRQHKLGYACSALLGENTIGRRSIAVLEALRWGAEIIVSIDDDNYPLSLDYFDRFESVLGSPFSGVQATSEYNWFDVGALLDPPAPHRGYPHQFLATDGWCAEPAADVRVGVAAGICLGDPDVSAITRIANHPEAHRVSELLRAGIVVEPVTYTVFNSQNTAFLRELAPCFLMVPQWGRYDDIFASLIAQRVMREKNMQVHFGQPFVWQQRNPHNLLADLQAEMFGMRNILEFAGWLDNVDLPADAPVVEMARTLYAQMGELSWMPAGVRELGLAWSDDCARVLAK